MAVSVVITGPHGDEPNSSTNKKDTISTASDLELDFELAQYSRSDSVESSSGENFDDESKMQDQSALPPVILPAVPPASITLHLPNKPNSALHGHSFFEAV